MSHTARLLSLIAFLLNSSRALGAEPTPAELAAAQRQYAYGMAAEGVGRWKDCADALQSVVEIKPDPNTHMHLGRCREELGQLVEASLEYERSVVLLKHNRAPAPTVALAEQRRAAVDARVPKLVLQLPPNVSSIEFELDRRPTHRVVLAAPIPLNPGAHTIAVRSPGKRPYEKTVSLTESITLTELVELPDEVHTQAGAVLLPAGTSDAQHSKAERGWIRTAVVVGEATIAITGAAMIVGASFQARSAEARIADDQAQLVSTVLPDGTRLPAGYGCQIKEAPAATCEHLYDALSDRNAASRLTSIGTVMLVGGGIAAGATWLLWSTYGRETHIIDRVGLRTDLRSVTLTGDF